MDKIRRILFTRTKRKGTRSEGPEYLIKPIDDYKSSEIWRWNRSREYNHN